MLVRKEVYLCRFNGFQSALLLCGDCFKFEEAKSKQRELGFQTLNNMRGFGVAPFGEKIIRQK